MQDIDILKKLYRDYFGSDTLSVSPLAGAGSRRKYFRIVGERTAGEGRQPFSCIGVAGDNLKDCQAFVGLSEVFADNGIAVPEVYACSNDKLHYIQRDLGDTSLFDVLCKSGMDGAVDSEIRTLLVKESLSRLAKMQLSDPSLWESRVVYNPFSIRQAMWDLNYFKYEYLRPSGIDYDEELLEDDFEAMARDLCEESGMRYGFMYRDFQSRNIMVCDGEPLFIDFQGGRRGPGIYDAISMLWQAKMRFPDAFRREMLDYYFQERNRLTGEKRDKERERYLTNLFALFRTFQVLGAYGLRGLVERKSHFIESIPAALANLRDLVACGASDNYPELKKACEKICSDGRFMKDAHSGLLIKVFSFSYKKGYPLDFTGNGGGFMFDCRGMHNPGRYEQYRSQTGLDRDVVDFLESRGEVQDFVDRAVAIVSPSVETYLRRNFSDLQVGFGCTGGRHRSVYCAERAAHMIAKMFPDATVRVIHREQGIERIISC